MPDSPRVINASDEITHDAVAVKVTPTRNRSFLDGFRRITSSGAFIPEIDGLRFIAISLVILHHLALFVSIHQQHPEGWFELGQRGVELFFAISGFILSVPFAMHYVRGEKPVRLGWYFWRRFTRIEPPYLISLLILTAMRVVLRHEDFSIIWWNLLFSAFYVHGFMKGMPSQINGVAWSLEIEMQFYLLMPLLALIFLIKNRWLRRAVMLLLVAGVMSIQPIYFRSVFPDLVFKNGQIIEIPFYLDRHLINFIQYFVIGMLLADVYVTEWGGAPPPLKRAPFAWGDFVWLIGWPALAMMLIHGGTTARIGFPIMIFALYLALFQSVCFRRLMRIQLLTVIGGMCYSIYLFHNPVIQVFGPFVQRTLPVGYVGAVGVLAVFMVPLILALCGVYFRLIEKPCMDPKWATRLAGWVSSMLFVEEKPPTSSQS